MSRLSYDQLGESVEVRIADILGRGERDAPQKDRQAREDALRLLVHYNLEGSSKALEQFHARYQDNPLVLDKWFVVQATAPSHGRCYRRRKSPVAGVELENNENVAANSAFSLLLTLTAF